MKILVLYAYEYVTIFYFTFIFIKKTPEDKDEHVSNFNNDFHSMYHVYSYIKHKSSLFYQDFFS